MIDLMQYNTIKGILAQEVYIFNIIEILLKAFWKRVWMSFCITINASWIVDFIVLHEGKSILLLRYQSIVRKDLLEITEKSKDQTQSTQQLEH